MKKIPFGHGIAVASLLLLVFFHGQLLSTGSLHRMDDTLYAQIMREAGEGQIHPLRFSGIEFQGKPPLVFWMGGLFSHLFGDQEASYRLPSFLVFLFLLVAVYGFLGKERGRFTAWMGVGGLLGSPLLLSFSERVMLDLPLTFTVVCIALSAASRSSAAFRWLCIFGVLGWWIKEVAILPAFLGGLSVFLLDRESRHRWGKENWIMLAVSIAAMALAPGTWRQLYLGSTAGLQAAQTLATEFPPPGGLYWKVLLLDQPLIWLALIHGVFAVSRFVRNAGRRVDLSFFLVSLLGWGFALAAETKFPHYLLPAVATSIVSAVLLVSETERKSLRTLLVVAISAQIGWAHWRVYGDPFTMDPNRDIKRLAMTSSGLIPLELPICVVNMYFGIVRFYSNRSTLNFHTDHRNYQALARFSEFRPFLREVPPSELQMRIRDECGGYVILPTRELRILPLTPEALLATSGGYALAFLKERNSSPLSSDMIFFRRGP